MKHEHTDPEATAQDGRSGPSLKLVLLLIVVAAVAVFFFQNFQEADVEFLWFEGQWPVWVVIGISLLAGIVIDRLASWLWRRARNS